MIQHQQARHKKLELPGNTIGPIDVKFYTPGVHRKTKMYMHDSTTVWMQPSKKTFLLCMIWRRPSAQDAASCSFRLPKFSGQVLLG